MKVLFTGASGNIGGEVLAQCLAHPNVTSVIAFVRRELPAERCHPKLESVIIKDFSIWPEEVLKAHADAVGMIWCMGTSTPIRSANLEYPLAFIESMARVLGTTNRSRFRYIHLSGMFVRQDQEKKLWFLEEARKIKGVLETESLDFAEKHADIWRTFITKPGGVATKNIPGHNLMASLMGPTWVIRGDELGAAMTYLAVDGDAEREDSILQNLRLAEKGREILAAQRRDS